MVTAEEEAAEWVLYGWSTADELRFVLRLGTHATPGQHGLDRPLTTTARCQLMARYLELMPLRVRWGRINPVELAAKIRRYLDTDLAIPV